MEKINKNRRNFLKVVFFGIGTIIIGKILSLVYTSFTEGQSIEKDFDSFRTVENKKGVTIYDKDGEEIFIMDSGR